mmetsp:Transcript_17801/g.26502  ORF Transcript_17801/g.26502 Transcript_17801/m.26502 type:complete len:120 (+) Transcript_17801:615-974(+)
MMQDVCTSDQSGIDEVSKFDEYLQCVRNNQKSIICVEAKDTVCGTLTASCDATLRFWSQGRYGEKLQAIAKKRLMQIPSSAQSENLWSVVAGIFTKKRNCLDTDNLGFLVLSLNNVRTF